MSMGWLPTNLAEGGSGFLARSASRLNFQDCIAPPAETWRVQRTSTGGTFTIGISIGGLTSSTNPLASNANAATIESALNSLANVVAAAGSFCVARGDIEYPRRSSLWVTEYPARH